MYRYILLSLALVSLASCSLTPSTPAPAVSGESISVAAPVLGSGTKKLQYFADFQCPACIRFSEELLPYLESLAESGKLEITYKQFPLTGIHKNAYRDSLAATCAAAQGKYHEYKSKLYALEKSKNGATVTDDDRIALTTEITGIDGALFTKCLASDATKARVDQDMADGDALRVNGTPTLILDGAKVDLAIFRSTEMFQNYMSGYVNR